MTERRPWSADDDAYMRAHYPSASAHSIATHLGRTERAVYMRSSALGLRKSAEYLASGIASRFQPGQLSGVRFARGQAPWNKGLEWDAGGRSALTRFRKGQRNGMAAKNWKPIGHERVSKDGILQRKISDTGVTRQDYVPVHVLAWTSAHGPVPRGHIVLFVNKDRTDMRLENLVCVSRADNMRRNTVHRYPKEIALAVQAVGVLNRKINKLEGKHA